MSGTRPASAPLDELPLELELPPELLLDAPELLLDAPELPPELLLDAPELLEPPELDELPPSPPPGPPAVTPPHAASATTAITTPNALRCMLDLTAGR